LSNRQANIFGNFRSNNMFPTNDTDQLYFVSVNEMDQLFKLL